MEQDNVIGLALSGGGARGLAHIGVLKVLEKHQIPIHVVAGTSMGSYIGAAYAAGMPCEEIEREAIRLQAPRQLFPLLDMAFPRRGLINADRIISRLTESIGNLDFSDLPRKFGVTAVDLNSLELVVISTGVVSDAVRASIAVPGIFAPIHIDDRYLVDGGILENVPARTARKLGADRVIAVDVSSSTRNLRENIGRTVRQLHLPGKISETITILVLSMNAARKEANQHSLAEGSPDLVIAPNIPDDIALLTGFNRTREIIELGEQAANQSLPEIYDIVR